MSPSTLDLIKEAILDIGDRKGSSVYALNKWIESEKQTAVKKHVMKAALKKGEESGDLIRNKGSYKVSAAGKKPKTVKKKTTAAKAKAEKKKAATAATKANAASDKITPGKKKKTASKKKATRTKKTTKAASTKKKTKAVEDGK